MAQALYRKYRPQTFADVTGQEHVKRTIQNEISAGSITHAYLFSGPRGVGKTTIARLLAKAANCENQKDGEACDRCQHCQEFAGGRAMDVVEIDAASHTGVDNVRENIIDAVRFAPGQGKYKVFIIDEVHMLSASAFNALLKTLEEPPAHAIFVLATTEIHKIPATIISRCQRFDFHKVSKEDLTERLKMITKAEGVKVDDEVFDSIARVSEGCVRDAESLLGQILALGDKKITVEEASLVLPSTYIETVKEIANALLENDASRAVEVINKFIESGGQVKPFLDEMVEHVRELMMEGVRSQGSGIRECKMLDMLLEVRAKQAPEGFPQLPFEIFVVEYCSRDQGSGVRDKGGKDDDPDATPPAMGQGEGGELSKKDEPPAIKSEVKEGVSTASFSIEELKAKWGRCCDIVAKTNIALPLVIQKGEPIGVYGNKVHVSFKQSFHFEMMSQRKNLDILSAAINEIMNCKIEVMPVFEQDEAEKVIGELADAFGGVVVD